MWFTTVFWYNNKTGSNINYCILNAGDMQPFFGENTVNPVPCRRGWINRLPKGDFETFPSKKYAAIAKSVVAHFTSNPLWLGLFWAY